MNLPVPDYLRFAFAEHWVTETPGPPSNARINEYLACVGLPPDDAIPWCMAAIAFCLKQTGYHIIESGLVADWVDYMIKYGGVSHQHPRQWDLFLLHRQGIYSGLGHGGFYMGEDHNGVFLYGANQVNKWCVQPYDKFRTWTWFTPRKVKVVR